MTYFQVDRSFYFENTYKWKIHQCRESKVAYILSSSFSITMKDSRNIYKSHIIVYSASDQSDTGVRYESSLCKKSWRSEEGKMDHFSFLEISYQV